MARASDTTTRIDARPEEGSTPWATVAAATFAGFAAAMQVGKAAAALPLIRAEMGTGLTTLALYATLVSAVAATLGLAFGGVVARIGARRAGFAGLALIALGSAGGAAAPGVGALLASRAPEAMGFALVATAMPALIGRAAAPGGRALALGLWATWLPVGIAAAMAVVLAAPALGWRGLFAACALAPALAAAVLWRLAPPDARPGSAGRLRPPPAAALPLAGAFAAFSAANLVVVTFLPTMLYDEIGLAPRLGAGVGLLANLALVPGNLAAGWLGGRGAGGRALMAAAFAGMLFCAVPLFAAGAPAGLRLASAMGYGLFCGVVPAVVWGSIPLVAQGPSEGPLVSGAFYQGAGIGQIAGPLVASQAVALWGGWGAALWVVAVAVAAGLALVALVPAGLYAAPATP